MYHIQRDRRAQRSAQRIGQGLLTCLAEKPYAEVTVTDVQRAARVGRSTFYRLFDNTSDVLAWLCDGVFEQARQANDRLSRQTADETTLQFIRIWMENRTLLKAIVDSGRTDILHRAHMKYLPPNDAFFPETGAMDGVQLEYMMAMLTSCMTAFLRVWISGGGRESAAQLQERVRVCFRMLGNVFP
ncbi:MAG: TetR/AcrR family transcriptional regulator [Aristaeellaceae bacterium]